MRGIESDDARDALHGRRSLEFVDYGLHSVFEAPQLLFAMTICRSGVDSNSLLRDTNRRDEARAMLADIYNWFTEGFDPADLKDAKALLDELSGSEA